MCVSVLAVSVYFGDGGDSCALAFTILPLMRLRAAEIAAEADERARVKRAFDRHVSEICVTLDEMCHIYNRTLVALFRQNIRVMRDMARRSSKLCREAEARRRSGVSFWRGSAGDMGVWLFGTRAALYLAEVCEALDRIVRPACEHVECGGGAFSKEQTVVLMRMNDAVDAMTHKVTAALSEELSADGADGVRRQRDDVLEFIGECTVAQIERGGDDAGAKGDLLFMMLLGETKTLTLRMSNLLKIKRYSIQAAEWDDE